MRGHAGERHPPAAAAGYARNTIAILTPGYLSPNYNVGTVMAMLKVKW